MTYKEIIQKTTNILNQIIKNNHITIWDIEMVKEGKNLYLRVYIDKEKENEYVSVSDCEYVSRKLSQQLDEDDLIEVPYMLEVSSPGINRALKRDSDFLKYIGHLVDIKFFKPIIVSNKLNSKTKSLQGILQNYNDEIIFIEYESATYEFNKKDVASCRLAVVF